jgi:hypothetical protein
MPKPLRKDRLSALRRMREVVQEYLVEHPERLLSSDIKILDELIKDEEVEIAYQEVVSISR